MHVKLRISRQTGSQINKEGPQQETQPREQQGEMDRSEGDGHQPGRPESWELDKQDICVIFENVYQYFY